MSPSIKHGDRQLQLDLGSCGCGDAGAIALAEALNYCSKMTKLDIRGNSIGNEGAMALEEVSDQL